MNNFPPVIRRAPRWGVVITIVVSAIALSAGLLFTVFVINAHSDISPNQFREAREAKDRTLPATNQQSPSVVPVLPAIALIGQPTFSGDGVRYMTGVVTNNSRAHIRRAVIKFNVYDEHDARIGTATDSITDFEPRGQWAFRAAIYPDAFHSVRFESLQAFP